MVGSRVKHYEIESILGKGGMGSVYLATHLGTGRPVAVKVITPQFMMNDEFVERFRREAKAAGRLHHPNVVNVTDFGFARVDGERIAYLVMEYLDGCTLAEVLAEESQLPIDWVVDIIEQTSSAVEEAHQQGIIHRDLKPDNIWLEPNRRGGYTVKVLDFGLAKLGDVQEAGTADGISATTSYSQDKMRPPGSATALTNLPRRTGVFEAKTYAQAADNSEGATQIQRSPLAEDATLLIAEEKHTDALPTDEAATRVLPLESSEALTQMQPGPASEEERTRVFEHTTAGGRIRSWAIDRVNRFLPADRALQKKPPVQPNVLVIGATNRAGDLDPARAGFSDFNHQCHRKFCWWQQRAGAGRFARDAVARRHATLATVGRPADRKLRSTSR
jgi:tRNA A-37 threonylcarbamoyl transferase component Bud32